MSERERDEHSGTETTGHEWDGIKELDNPLPRWWLWIFYGCIVVAIVYWVLMPAWPGLNGYTPGVLKQSDRADVASELQALQVQRGRGEAMLATASLQQIESDPALQAHALSVGQSVFGDNCATCHGAGGGGTRGYPNLRDDVWLWGGSLEEIEHTLRVGVRSAHPQARTSQMPAFGRENMLTPAQVSDLTEYVVALSGRPADAAAVGRAQQLYADNCAACHTPTGVGDQAQGAPNLTDREWLYGSDRDSIRGQIHNGRNGVMPSWEGRFSPAVIKALAVYVHVNAGGGAEVPGVVEPAP
ncbi:MAG: cytochrome-c oxidase, cbb3-type subunit III [Alphaproteobacteria bacterium]|jgi:cytochrome c oxidase cbb3-type subunit III|nr:cytochrome-c oxidase, cbb3-type subunit III [Alphaproteobacteria bacterium]MBU2040571.1 cytochrome-c oxidase, cbb3-type subunit III [Alphaproteobacteria bacterium]MBU2125240.1 cytochrome-c oxidase, cbb3-type subunit III [Alphaproteobacteria bacterium]MBU2209968.1 cytochrome-c oxidase, cbb3-type subunit III [Alphaproteobacteria bacterium]MBU2290678.1 cytochrome-c oxidase, cbb3-type subunit III [Alphaproteobacteria bacterium]